MIFVVKTYFNVVFISAFLDFYNLLLRLCLLILKIFFIIYFPNKMIIKLSLLVIKNYLSLFFSYLTKLYASIFLNLPFLNVIGYLNSYDYIFLLHILIVVLLNEIHHFQCHNRYFILNFDDEYLAYYYWNNYSPFLKLF